jgi:hypothetical protein
MNLLVNPRFGSRHAGLCDAAILARSITAFYAAQSQTSNPPASLQLHPSPDEGNDSVTYSVVPYKAAVASSAVRPLGNADSSASLAVLIACSLRLLLLSAPPPGMRCIRSDVRPCSGCSVDGCGTK